MGEREVQVGRGKWVRKGECTLRAQINIPGGIPGDSVGPCKAFSSIKCLALL